MELRGIGWDSAGWLGLSWNQGQETRHLEARKKTQDSARGRVPSAHTRTEKA